MLLSELRSPSKNSPLLCSLHVLFPRDLAHFPQFTAVSLRSPKSLPFSDDGGSRGCHRMTSDSLAVTTVTRLIISPKFSEPDMRWIVQITIPTQVALSWGNPLRIKGPLLKAYRPSCQKQPDVSRQHQFTTSLRILTWTKYRWAGWLPSVCLLFGTVYIHMRIYMHIMIILFIQGHAKFQTYMFYHDVLGQIQ